MGVFYMTYHQYDSFMNTGYKNSTVLYQSFPAPQHIYNSVTIYGKYAFNEGVKKYYKMFLEYNDGFKTEHSAEDWPRTYKFLEQPIPTQFTQLLWILLFVILSFVALLNFCCFRGRPQAVEVEIMRPK